MITSAHVIIFKTLPLSILLILVRENPQSFHHLSFSMPCIIASFSPSLSIAPVSTLRTASYYLVCHRFEHALDTPVAIDNTKKTLLNPIRNTKYREKTAVKWSKSSIEVPRYPKFLMSSLHIQTSAPVLLLHANFHHGLNSGS